jgi:bifunctional UDP-N-acetylglucosamine pyrophosphorylase/glucosamine-1-phosphate N-acetyltransferase
VNGLAAAVLAAGQGTRMASDLPKVLHEVAGRTLLSHTQRAVEAMQPAPRPIVVVLGHAAEKVRAAVAPTATTVVQDPQRGTADALRAAAPLLRGCSAVLVVYGDVPLVRPETLSRLAALHASGSSAATLLTARVDEPAEYGRVVRDAGGDVAAIVEAGQATPEHLGLREVNTGIGIWDAAWLWPALETLPASPSGEWYLTDLVAAAVASGRPVAALELDDAAEGMGVNTRADLAAAEAALRARIRARHLEGGVTMVAPDQVWIDDGVTIGRDTVIWPGTYVLAGCSVGSGVTLGPGALLRDSSVGDGARVELSVVEGAEVGAGCAVGPFAHLRPGARLDPGARVGNFVEVKGSRIGRAARASHFAYIGDADVGAEANIGAGTVTCNFDGQAKHRTTIGPGALVGSGTMLVAPVTVGEGARTGAGSVVLDDVKPGETVAGVPARPVKGSRE